MLICQLKACTVLSLFYLYRVDHLYTFFVQWSPEIYAKGNKKHHKPHYLIREKHQKHYLVVEKNKVAVINKLLSNPVIPTATNWEVRVTVTKAPKCLAVIPELLGKPIVSIYGHPLLLHFLPPSHAPVFCFIRKNYCANQWEAPVIYS